MAERRSRGRESRRAARNREYRIPEMPKEDLERINARRRKKKGGALIPLIAVLLIMILAGGLCIAFACGDEYHQSFVAGRSPAKADVAIDSLGALFGIILVQLFCHSFTEPAP